MIVDPSVFADEPAETLLHREREVESLLRAWKPALEGEVGDEVIVSGSSGVGKTSLVQHTIDRLESEADIEHAYAQCLGVPSRKLLTSILQQHPNGALPDADRSLAALTEALQDAVTDPYIVVLDEAEGLPDSGALDRLADVPGLSTVVVVHEPNRWRSRLSTEAVSERYIDATHVPVPKFGVNELANILRARAQAGLPPHVVSRPQLERIADEVVGVARYGIQALRAAAELATERGVYEIGDADIENCFQRARGRIRRLNLRSLSIHHHILYALIHAAGAISGVELHDRYDAVAERAYVDTTLTPIVRRTRRDRLRKLEEYDLIRRDGTGATTYRPVDSSIQPPVSVTNFSEV